jgi:folate-dependent phosphoribosylglycinamide formyltransferase PurN
MKLIYERQPKRPMKVAVFFSGSASSMQAMLKDLNHGALYRVVVGFTNKEDCAGVSIAAEAGISVIRRNFKTFCQERGLDPKDFGQRAVYYEAVVQDIRKHKPDLICLSGFTGPGSIIVDPLLTEYADRILNVHPADLAILASKGSHPFPIPRLYAGNLSPQQAAILISDNCLERRYKGEDAVYDAIISGEEYTRSSVHIARKEFDEGPILARSKRFPVQTEWLRGKVHEKNFRAIRQYADQLQETMKWEGDGPAYLKALELISSGRIAVDGEKILLDGQPLPYAGLGLD